MVHEKECRIIIRDILEQKRENKESRKKLKKAKDIIRQNY